jgi:HNH endonuclease
MNNSNARPAEQRLCIYCNRLKDETDFTLEHIFPESLGGNLCPDLFRTRDVCGRCNSTCGLFVDAPFIKNWFRTNDEAIAARQYLDPNASDAIEPLVYLGQIPSLVTDAEEVCEVWLAACGARAFHFRSKDDARYDTYIGGNPINRKSDPGCALLYLTSRQEIWIKVALRSFAAHFRKVELYSGNFVFPEGSPDWERFKKPDSSVQHYADRIRPVLNSELEIKIKFQLGFETRFL